MKRRLAALGLVSVSILLVGCSQKISSTTDEKAIHAAELAWASDCSSGDLEKVLSHYAESATVKIPGRPVMNSRDSIRLGLSTLPVSYTHLRFSC